MTGIEFTGKTEFAIIAISIIVKETGHMAKLHQGDRFPALKAELLYAGNIVGLPTLDELLTIL